jgi:hypothetical protein
MAFLEYRPTQTVYKYCSSDGFIGIIKSKHLWFSDLASMNDPREIKLGHEHFLDALQFVRQQTYPGERGEFLSVLADRVARYRKNCRTYCCCFSVAADELPMWSAYGQNYSGMAIGFRPTALFGIPARVQKVRYLDENTPEDFRHLVRDIASQFDVLPIPNDAFFWISAAVAAVTAMTALKHNTWAYEKEVRIVHSQRLQPIEDEKFNFKAELPDGQIVKWTKPLERSTDSGQVSYLEFPFGLFRKGVYRPERAIEKVILGPKCSLTQAEATAILENNGFENFDVVKSACEIR